MSGRKSSNLKKLQADRTATLNERDAIKERERVALQNEARDKERASRPDSGVKIYELTVENSDEPGLPAPVGATNNLTSATLGVEAAAQQLSVTHELNAPANKAVEAKKTPPPFDPMLDESERILEDYISLLPKSGSLTVNP